MKSAEVCLHLDHQEAAALACMLISVLVRKHLDILALFRVLAPSVFPHPVVPAHLLVQATVAAVAFT